MVKIVGDYAWEQGQQRFGITQTLDDFVQTTHVPFLVRLLRRIQTRVAQGAVRVIVPSEYLKDIVIQWGIPEKKITIINNSIQLPAHIPTPEKRKANFSSFQHTPRPMEGF